MTIVYSCIAGGYDAPTSRQYQHYVPGWRYIMLADPPVAMPPPWEVLPIPCDAQSEMPRLTARMIKCMPHRWLPDHERSIWIDGNIGIRDDIAKPVRIYLGRGDCATFPHMRDQCVYEHAGRMIRIRHDWPYRILTQMLRYDSAGFPPGINPCETGVLMRNNTPLTRAHGERWADQIKLHSIRDQLSFMPIARECGLKVESFMHPSKYRRIFPILQHADCTRRYNPDLRSHPLDY